MMVVKKYNNKIIINSNELDILGYSSYNNKLIKLTNTSQTDFSDLTITSS